MTPANISLAKASMSMTQMWYQQGRESCFTHCGREMYKREMYTYVVNSIIGEWRTGTNNLIYHRDFWRMGE